MVSLRSEPVKHREGAMMRASFSLMVAVVLCMAAALTLPVAGKTTSVTMTISDPNPAPEVGETFETTLSFSTDNIAIGAYHLTVHYDSDVFRILQITMPDESEFADNTFVDVNSFSSGKTIICAFQTEHVSAQPTLRRLATIKWRFLAEPKPCSTIYLSPETLVDAFWKPVDDFNSSPIKLNPDPIPPRVNFVEIPGLQRSSVNFIQVHFERHAIVSEDALIVRGQDTGLADISDANFAYFHHSYGLWPATTAYWHLPASLPDDVYTVKIVDTAVRLAADPNIILDGDGDCLPGGDYVTGFHRLLGDADGNARVGFGDLSLLASRWVQSPGYCGLDTNRDNTINFFDFATFAKNWLKSQR